MTIRDLTGGRQLLSDDLSMLSSVALLVARRIDAIRLSRERYDQSLREQEMAKLAAEAELRALRAQINPHFLFNALTTIGYLIQVAPERALQTLMRLTALLRAVLRSEGEFTTLGQEVDLIEAYLDIERARFEERLTVKISVPAHLRQFLVPALVLQPLVENAVKHGIAPERAGGAVVVTAELLEPVGDLGRIERTTRQLRLVVTDSGRGTSEASIQRGRLEGVGLKNVVRRLTGHYGPAGTLSIHTSPGQGTRVEVRLPATTIGGPALRRVAP